MAEVNRLRAGQLFRFELTGRQGYELLEILRQRAIESPAYETVERCVRLERLLWEQQRKQGWNGDPQGGAGD